MLYVVCIHECASVCAHVPASEAKGGVVCHPPPFLVVVVLGFCLFVFWVLFCSKTGFLTEPEAHSNFPRRLSSPGALQTYLAPLSMMV